MSTREVGRVVGLWRYPVKSMAAEALESVEVGWHGLAGDRRWAFVRGGLERSGFPWMTIREDAAMWRYRAAVRGSGAAGCVADGGADAGGRGARRGRPGAWLPRWVRACA